MFESQPKQKRLQIAADLLDRFRKSLEGFEDLPPQTRNDDSLLLALGQHYGLPTRLLDWTESPYIAAFFAFNRSALWGAHDQWIAIWVLDSTNPIWSADYGVEIIDVPSFGNERIRNQSGKFTLSKTPFSALEDYALEHGDENALMKWLLPSSEWKKALADLDAMAIHHGRMYPEREGAAQMALFRTVAAHGAFIERPTSRPA
jgi:FRG domain.